MVYYPYFPQNAIKIYDTTVVQNLEDLDRAVTKRDIAEKLWAINNLPSKYHPSEFDIGPFGRDETWMEFVKWRMMGEEDQTVEYVESLPTRIFAIPTEGKPVFYNKGGLTIAYAEGIFNFRDTGVLISKAYDLQRHATDFMRSPEGYQLAIEHPDLLKDAPNIDYIVVGKIPGSPTAIYGVSQVSEDSALLFGNIDSYKMIDGWARREGIPTENLILRAMGEEFSHLIRRGVASVEEEIDVREWLIGIYTSLAEKSLDSKSMGKYQKIVSHLEKDLATVRQRYSKAYSRNIESLADVYISDPGKLELILEAEARLEYGLTDKGEVAKYVAGKLGKIAEAAEKEYSLEDRIVAEEASEHGENAEAAEVCAAESNGAEDGGGGDGGEGSDGSGSQGGDGGGGE